MASPQKENGFTALANEIWDEIIRRDFTKRQKDIMQFILRLSYGCNKKTAHVPLLKDFALCGVSPTQISNELNYLKMCKVIDWDRDDMIFAFNKNYEIWQVSPVKWWNDERFKQLLHMNITTKTSQNMNFTKHELHEKGSLDFMKSEVGQASNPWESKAEGVSKDSIKDFNKEEEKDSPKTAMDAYYYSFKKINYTGHIQGYISDLMRRGYTDAFVREVFLAMGAYGAGPNIEYMKSLAEDWISKGIYTFAEAKRRHEEEKKKVVSIQTGRQQAPTVSTPKEFVPDENDEVYQMIKVVNGDV